MQKTQALMVGAIFSAAPLKAHPWPPETCSLFAEAIRDLNFSECRYAAGVWLKTQDFPPTVAQFRTKADTYAIVRENALTQWSTVRHAVEKWGPEFKPGVRGKVHGQGKKNGFFFGNPITAKVVALFDWQQICEKPALFADEFLRSWITEKQGCPAYEPGELAGLVEPTRLTLVDKACHD